jgi:hypothetical protein
MKVTSNLPRQLLYGWQKNIELLDHPYFEMVYALPYAEVDEIYNLACPASPVHYQYNPY